MKFVALFTGAGEGCDYTIGCNKTFAVFEALNQTHAIAQCKETWQDHGGSEGDCRIETIALYSIDEEVQVPIAQWNKEGKEEAERKEAEAELKKIEARAQKLRAKLGNKSDNN